MANHNHLEILRKGVRHWNESKENDPDTVRDLSNADLTGLDLRGANFTQDDLSFATLRRADLREADLTDANLLQADLHDADFTGAGALWVQLTLLVGPAVAGAIRQTGGR